MLVLVSPASLAGFRSATCVPENALTANRAADAGVASERLRIKYRAIQCALPLR